MDVLEYLVKVNHGCTRVSGQGKSWMYWSIWLMYLVKVVIVLQVTLSCTQ